jgi:hypothetical protein
MMVNENLILMHMCKICLNFLYAYAGVTSIDTTAIEGLLETSKILERKGIKVYIS